jgi:predicted deacetylase
MSWLDPLIKALDESPSAIPFFFRDDDVGWEDARLFEMLDVFGEHNLPVDLAVIPKSLSRETAKRLRQTIDAGSTRLSVHQHGYAHINHEREGRKNEFGPSRSWREQLEDVKNGQALLLDLLGPINDAIFTPPWNRCTGITAICLWEAGFKYVSRDKTAPALDAPELKELSISVDWFAHRKGIRLTSNEFGNLLAAAVRDQPAVGVMFHHAVMDDYELRRLRQFLQFISTHPKARGVLMRDTTRKKHK